MHCQVKVYAISANKSIDCLTDDMSAEWVNNLKGKSYNNF